MSEAFRPIKRRLDDDGADDDRPRQKRYDIVDDEPKKRRSDDDDDSRPRRRRDEDSDDRPRNRYFDTFDDDERTSPRRRRKKKKAGSSLMLVLLLVGVGVVVAGIIITIVVLTLGGGGSGSRSFSLQTGHTQSWEITFRKNQRVEISVTSENQSDVDLFIFDARGNLVAVDDGDSKDCLAVFFADETQAFKVEVRNMNRVDQPWRNGFNSGTMSYVSTEHNGPIPKNQPKFVNPPAFNINNPPPVDFNPQFDNPVIVNQRPLPNQPPIIINQPGFKNQPGFPNQPPFNQPGFKNQPPFNQPPNFQPKNFGPGKR